MKYKSIIYQEIERRKNVRAERKRLFKATMIRRCDIQQLLDAALKDVEKTENAEKN